MQEVSETVIRDLVDVFYCKVRADERLGPIFDRAIGDDWDLHLSALLDFWSSLIGSTGRYKGSLVVAHQRVSGIAPELFPRWLELFSSTCRELFAPEIAAGIEGKARHIAASLRRGLFYRPGLVLAEAER